MKFEKRFFFSVIPEWKDQYISLEGLTKQIEAIKNAAIRLVQSIANIKKLDGDRNIDVDLHSIRSDKLFWEMLEENLHKVQAFYETQLSSFLEQFHALTLQAILLNKIDEYIPFNPGQATKLERELGRLPNVKDMPIGVLGVDEQVHRPIGSDRFMVLNKLTNIDEVKAQIRQLKPTVKKLLKSSIESKLRQPSDAPTAWNLPNLRLQADDMRESSVEDHVRDFQYACAQLEESQERHRAMHPHQTPFHYQPPNNMPAPTPIHTGYSHLLSGQPPRLQPTGSLPAGMHPHHPANNIDYHQHLGLYDEDSDTDTNFGPPMAREQQEFSRSGRDPIQPLHLSAPSFTQSVNAHSALNQRDKEDALNIAFKHQEHAVDWRQDDFFRESDSDSALSFSRSENPLRQSGSFGRLESSIGAKEAGFVPTAKLARKPSGGASQPPSEPNSARRIPTGPPSSYSSFFGSEDERSEDEEDARLARSTSSAPVIRPMHRSYDSEDDEDHHASSDSGYASGGSGEGFVDEGANEEQEHEKVRSKKDNADGDTETTGSRHHHVPETRLRTQKPKDGTVSSVGAPTIAGVSTQNESPIASLPRPPSPSSSERPKDDKSKAIVQQKKPSNDAMEQIATSSRAGSIGEIDVQPLLGQSQSINVATLKPHTVRQKGSMDEVEMQTFESISASQKMNDGMRAQSEPDMLSLDMNQGGRSNDGKGGRGLGARGEREKRDAFFAAEKDSYISRSGGPLSPKKKETKISLAAAFDGNIDDEDEDEDGPRDPPPPRTTFYQLPDPRHLNREKALKGLQAGFSELYRGLHLLKRYAELNVEAVDKVLAKYDKNIARGFRAPYMAEEMSQYPFNKATELKSLISQTEYVYAQAFTNGHRTPAMSKLRVPEEEEDMETTELRFGLLFGLSLGFALIILYMCLVVSSTVVQKMRPDLIVYRMLFVSTLMLWYWGVDMWIWSTHRVNYPFIFEFNTRGHMKHQNIFDIASVFTVVLIGDMMLFMLSALQRYDPDFIVPGFQFLLHVPPESFPLVLVVLLLGLFLFYSIRSGFWLVRTLGRIVTAPFYQVVFRDFFMADQLVSISLVLQDIDFTICYFTTCAFRGGGNSCATNHLWMTAILSTIPQLWRLLQCLRRYHDSKDKTQLYNAGKYCTGMLVAICSSMRSIVKSTPWLVFWLITVIIATVYSYGWDIYKDWSLGDRKSHNWMLRDQLLYPKWWYYFAAVVNLILRLMWTLTISPEVVAAFFRLGKDGFTTILVALEVSRRAMWNVFRLENEQLNNCGKFRAVQDIPLPLPLKPAVEEELYHDKIK